MSSILRITTFSWIAVSFITWQASLGTAGDIRFVDATQKAGLASFHHRLGSSDKKWIIEAMGSGVAVSDYDNDGDDDIYFVNGRPGYDQPDQAFSNALFQNQGGSFKNVSKKAGVNDTGFGMCAVFGDTHNDGWVDLFVGNYGANVFYRNNGDGTFTDTTQESGLANDQYAASASFADVDRDGDLDLFVGNYVDFDPVKQGNLYAQFQGQRVFMGPMAFDSQRDLLYLNDGTGRFIESSYPAQINVSKGRAMGSVFFDLENDGDADLYVTNDSTYNHILQNRGDATFEDISFISGGGFSDSGRGGASMGVSAGDYNNDGYFDLFITSYHQESDILYRNERDGTLSDETAFAGLFHASLKRVTWGNGFCDFDSDGLLDLYTANGHVYPQADHIAHMSYGQGVSIYQNKGTRFQDISKEAVPSSAFNRSGRGSALLDFDNDGDMDIVVNCMDSSPLLLENQSHQGNWLQVRLKERSAYTFCTRIVAQKGNRKWSRMVDGGSGYLSQNSQVVHFGFGSIQAIDRITVYWPHKKSQEIENPGLNQQIVIDSKQE